MSSTALKVVFLSVISYSAVSGGPLWSTVKLGGSFFLLVVGFLFLRQNDMLYVPCPDPTLAPRRNSLNPSDVNLKYETVRISASDNTRLHGWFIQQRSAESTKEAVTVLYFHGNAGNISHRLELLRDMQILTGANIIAAEYRGYGESEGSPSETGIKQDALAFYQYALNHELIDSSKIIVFGRSLGGAVACSLALHAQKSLPRHQQPLGLILENTFTSVRDTAVALLPILNLVYYALRSPLLTNSWENIKLIPDLEYPILFLSSLKDEIVPPEQMKALKASCRQYPNTMFCSFPYSGHNDMPVTGGSRYYDTIKTFLSTILQKERTPRLREKAKMDSRNLN